MTDYGTFGDHLGRFEQEAKTVKPSRTARRMPLSEAGKMARQIMGTTETTLDEIVASTMPSLSDDPESVAVSLLSMAGDHPLATYARDVADSIQISRDSTFMIGLGLTSAAVGSTYCVKTPWDADLPLGLYVTAEQPPGAGKSGVMAAFQKPFRSALRRMNDARNNALDALEAQIDAADDPALKGALQEQMQGQAKPVRGWISNATPEALEKDAISPNDGFFMLASDERGLLNCSGQVKLATVL